MLRLDKFLCEMNIGSRSQVKACLKQGLISVNGVTASKPEMKIDEEKDIVTFRDEVLCYKKHVYYMLNKPKGVVSATEDIKCRTVSELLRDTGYRNLFPVGRLDKDTEGLLIMTNDGGLAHNLLSPKKHIDKVYYAELLKPLSPEAAKYLENGVDIGEEKPTLPATVELLKEKAIYLTITEGRYHQIKRMLQAVDNHVVYLKRVAMGGLRLDDSLPLGSYRELTREELNKLQKNFEV